MTKRILIVDDDASIVESLKFLLEDEGFNVETREDGSFVREKRYTNGMKPDLILLDYWLPGENGGDITRTLKKKIETKNIPVIIISASYNIKEQVFQAGADDFLQKPYDIDDILQIIDKHIIK